MERTYQNAVRIIRSRAFGRRGDKEPRTPGQYLGRPSLEGMKESLDLLGHTENDIRRLNVIHVAGTSGKGSTCAFTRCFLQAHGLRTGFPQKIGLFSSPDLGHLCQRIQIGDKPISEELFTKYFFDVFDQISLPEAKFETVKPHGPFQLLCLTAMQAFIGENVDAAIIEANIGGEFDSTNFFQQPITTVVTALGMDHVGLLGPTLEKIAWHKAGIFKSGSPALSAIQVPRAADVLKTRAFEKNVNLEFIGENESLSNETPVMKISVQRQNCSLALEVAGSFLKQTCDRMLTQEDISRGLSNFWWPGRFQTIREGSNVWHIDGAHRAMSAYHAAEWFVNCAPNDRPEILIFAQESNRNLRELLESLARPFKQRGKFPKYVIFTTVTLHKGGENPLSYSPKFRNFERELPIVWRSIDPKAVIFIRPWVSDAMQLAATLGQKDGGMQALVTGSLHLVGAAHQMLLPSYMPCKSKPLYGTLGPEVHGVSASI